jgi:hypothetical protein
MFGQPALHVWVGVGAVVVEDQVDLQIPRHLALDDAQEAQKLVVTVPVEAPADHRAGQYVQTPLNDSR